MISILCIVLAISLFLNGYLIKQLAKLADENTDLVQCENELREEIFCLQNPHLHYNRLFDIADAYEELRQGGERSVENKDE